MTYTMMFKDGTIIGVLPDDCGNWLSDEITAEMLTAENLSRVTVINSDTVTVLTDQVCEGIYPYENTFGFCLRDKTVEEKQQDTLDIFAGAIAELADLIAGGE